MNKGDILIVSKDNIELSDIYIIYDRTLALTFSIFGISIVNTENLVKENAKILTLARNINYPRRKMLGNFIAGLITGDVQTTIKERMNILKYILWMYKKILNINLIDTPIPVSISSLLKSRQLFHIK